jgi:hypothetical protein
MQESNESRYPYPMRLCVRFGALAAGAFLFLLGAATRAQAPGSTPKSAQQGAQQHDGQHDFDFLAGSCAAIHPSSFSSLPIC